MKHLCLLLLILCSTGCHVIMPESTTSGFNSANDNPSPVTYSHRAWLGKVTISDPQLEQKLTSGWWPRAPEKTAVEYNLRTNLLYYLKEKKYFSNISTLPGKPAADDVILDIDFNQYLHEKTPSGLGVFLGCFTVGIYWIIFNGRWEVDDFTYAATITVKDSDNHVLATASHSIAEERIIGFYNAGFQPSATSSAGVRTNLVDTLLGKILVQLPDTAAPGKATP